jgi:hypothetical protein
MPTHGQICSSNEYNEQKRTLNLGSTPSINTTGKNQQPNWVEQMAQTRRARTEPIWVEQMAHTRRARTKPIWVEQMAHTRMAITEPPGLNKPEGQ